MSLPGACTFGDPEQRADAAPSPSTTVRHEFATLREIADAIGCTGLEDLGTADNPGLRAFGICTLGRHNLDIYLVTDQSWSHLAEEFAAVSGPGWMVVCPTGAEAARQVHAAIGGTISGPGR